MLQSNRAVARTANRYGLLLVTTVMISAACAFNAQAQQAGTFNAVMSAPRQVLPAGSPEAGQASLGAMGAPTKPQSSSPGNQIQEVVVTAQKRSENINAIGLAITAASRQQLEQKQITSVSDLTRIEPSLQFSQTDYGTPVYTIRGVGYFEESLAATPAVSIYQDEVAFPFPVLSKGVLLDPERVEVLKGPQGTLFGENATGGAINFIAAKPTNFFTAGIDEQYGRFNDNLLSGFVSGPVTPTLSARLSASTEDGGAWQRSETRDDDLGNKDTQIARLLLDWKPTSKFTASVNLNGWLDHSDTQAAQLEGARFISPQYISPAALTPSTANFLPNAGYFPTYPGPIKSLVSQPIELNNDRQADWTPGEHPHNNEGFYQGALRLDYNFSDNLGITSLTTYERFTEHNVVDASGVGAAYLADRIGGNVETVSQEVRLHGAFDDNRVHWLAGVNYEDDKSRETDFFSPFFASSSYLTGGSAFSAIPLGSFEFGAHNNVNASNTSVFANVDYRVVETVTLHAGARHTQSDQDISGCSFGTSPYTAYIDGAASQLAAAFGGQAPTPVSTGQCTTLGPPPNFQPGTQYNKLNQNNSPWRVGVDWTPLPHELIYASISKGYKAGTSPSLGATSYVQLKPVTQESLVSYEIGAKSSLLDRSLQLNVDYFHYDYKDKQVLADVDDPLGIFGALQSLVNIPRSQEDGAEVTAVWRPPIAGLTLNGALTYLDSRVTSNFFNYGIYITSSNDTFNFKGQPFPFTPRYSVQYGARYDWSLTQDLSAFVSADASYQSDSTSVFGAAHDVAEGGPSLNIRSYNILNLTAGVASSDKHWRVEVWGRNVTNTYYWNTVVQEGDAIARLAGLPTTFGFGLHYRY